MAFNQSRLLLVQLEMVNRPGREAPEPFSAAPRKSTPGSIPGDNIDLCKKYRGDT